MFQYNLLKRRFSQNKILRIITVLKDKVLSFRKVIMSLCMFMEIVNLSRYWMFIVKTANQHEQHKRQKTKRPPIIQVSQALNCHKSRKVVKKLSEKRL